LRWILPLTGCLLLAVAATLMEKAVAATLMENGLRLVSGGTADLGITGLDLVRERGAEVMELLDLGVGRARLVVAVPEESRVKGLRDLAGARIATEFPGSHAEVAGSHPDGGDTAPFAVATIMHLH
jgi:ATP phosphoribosyltransferase